MRQVLEADHDAILMESFENPQAPALVCAVQNGCSEEIVQLLLEHRANPQETNDNGQMPLHVLSSKPIRTAVMMPFCDGQFAQRTPPGWGLEDFNPEENDCACATLLLRARASPDTADASGATALTMAVEKGNHLLEDLFQRHLAPMVD